MSRNYSEFSSSFGHGLNLESELDKIGRELEELSSKMDDPENGIKARMINPKVELAGVEKQLDQAVKIVEILGILTQASDQKK